MACSTPTIPPNAVEMLFAEDLINRIMYRHNGTQYKTWRAGPYREFILNAFNDDVEKAVDFIDMVLEWEVDEEFSKMVELHEVNEDAFVNFALRSEEISFKKGFAADNFLCYCVRLVSLAAYFDQYRVPRAPELALYFILKVAENFDLFEGGWDTLNTVAKKYVKRSEDFHNLLTPDVSEDENSSSDSDEDMDPDERNEVLGYFFDRDDGLANNQIGKLKDEPNLMMENLSASKEDVPSGSASKNFDTSLC